MGFGTAHIDNHAAYIDHWLKVLRGDRRFLFTAAAHAQRAVDWMVAAAAKGGVALDGGGPVDETGTMYEAEVRNVAA
jgi:antirestriction protein ArdC